MAPAAHAIQRVVRHHDVAAAVHADPRPLRVVDHVVCKRDVRGLVLQPRSHHELKSRALAGREAAGAGVVELVALDRELRGAPLGIHRPVARAVDLAADDVAVLHGDEVDGVVPRAGDVAVFDVHMLTLVHLERLLRHGIRGDRARAANGRVAQQDLRAGLEVKHVAAAGRDIEPVEIKVAAAKDVDRRQAGGAQSVDGANDDRGGKRAAAVFPVVGNHRLGIGARDEIDPDTLGKRDSGGHSPPGLGERPHGLRPRCAAIGVVAGGWVDPDIGHGRGADVEHRQRRIRSGANGHRQPVFELLEFGPSRTAAGGFRVHGRKAPREYPPAKIRRFHLFFAPEHVLSDPLNAKST